MIILKDRYILAEENRIIDMSKYDVDKIYFDPIYINETLIFLMKYGNETIIPTNQIKKIMTNPTYAIWSTTKNQKYEVEIDHKIKGVVYYDNERNYKYIETEEGEFEFEEVRERITKAWVTWKNKDSGNMKHKMLFAKNFKGKYLV